MEDTAEIQRILNDVYGETTGKAAFDKIFPIIKSHIGPERPGKDPFFPKGCIFNHLWRHVKKNRRGAFGNIHRFAVNRFKNVFSTIHILPFFPFSSDDGFSVIDFFEVSPELGNWKDIQRIKA